MDTMKYCKDCMIWKLSLISVRVSQSELRFCREKRELRFAYEYQCDGRMEHEAAQDATVVV
ncbi:hypothetical protein C3Y92_08575 [Solidesulfovibrio carbinolicus]|uniref:Uncharacterized protein n=1 Tax=Solidesulfovibrio carbinolicus TaxID=296842 RepID=A0A4P6HMR8_9BACT|nr:hypothetical protein C3Y92_08575 [Solidesulfovibrio carbinolicus]